MNERQRGSWPLTVLVTVGVLATACGHVAKIDKAGAVETAPTVFRLQMPASGDPDGTFFAQDATARSHGTLKVVVDSETYPSSLPANEAKLVAAMRAGKAAFSYEPAHDWAAVGVPAFEALDAPFLITTTAASQRLAHSPMVSTLLDGLRPLGMVGLALIPNEPRHILSARPLFSPADFNDVRVRIVDNPQTAALINALGAVPVQGDSASQAGEALIAGSLGALETSPAFVSSNSYNAEAPYFTSYALLSRFDVLAATKATWAALTVTQQAAVRRAAADTLAHSAQVATTEATELTQMCQAGLVFDQPTQSQLDSLVAASRAAMPTGAAAALVQAITASVPGSGATLRDLATPAGCHVAHTATQAVGLQRGATSPPTRATRTASIPVGAYSTTDTVADFRAVGQVGHDFDRAITTTTYLRADGTVIQDQKPDYPDQGEGRGTYVVQGDEVTFYWDAYTGLTPESLRWNYFDGQLTFTIIHVQDIAGRALYTSHPWRKVG